MRRILNWYKQWRQRRNWRRFMHLVAKMHKRRQVYLIPSGTEFTPWDGVSEDAVVKTGGER